MVLRIAVEARPNARVDRFEMNDNVLRVWVKSRAIDGQANQAIEQAIAEALDLRNRQVRLVSGKRSRHKTIEVDLADMNEVRGRLTQVN